MYDNFEVDWKEEVVSTMKTCSSLLELSAEYRLNIPQCVKKQKKSCDGRVT